jgi:hypothetical protein
MPQHDIGKYADLPDKQAHGNEFRARTGRGIAMRLHGFRRLMSGVRNVKRGMMQVNKNN